MTTSGVGSNCIYPTRAPPSWLASLWRKRLKSCQLCDANIASPRPLNMRLAGLGRSMPSWHLTEYRADSNVEYAASSKRWSELATPTGTPCIQQMKTLVRRRIFFPTVPNKSLNRGNDQAPAAGRCSSNQSFQNGAICQIYLQSGCPLSISQSAILV